MRAGEYARDRTRHSNNDKQNLCLYFVLDLSPSQNQKCPASIFPGRLIKDAMKKLFFDGSSRAVHRPALNGLGVVLVAFALASCSDKPQQQPPARAPGSSGKIVIKRSNTIGEELGPRLIAEYKKDHPAADFALESKGTGYGFAALMAGQCDLAAASRAPIKDELELAESRGF